MVGEGDAIAILINRVARRSSGCGKVNRLAAGLLTSVQSREVTFKQGDRSEVLALQRPVGSSAPAGSPATAAGPADGGGKLTMPTTASTAFAPFVQRATPKNGESDGL